MKRVFVLFIAVTLVIACQKEDDPAPQGNLPDIFSFDFMPLDIGNYWIYEHYSIDYEGNEDPMNRIDSIIISHDTLIGKRKYYVIEGTRWPDISERGIVSILRDSIGYLINQEGRIEMSQHNFTDTLDIDYGVFNDTLYCIYTRMVESDGPVTVPAGTFNVLTCRGELYNYRFDPPKKHAINMNKCYAENVGMVMNTLIYTSSEESHIEKRLLRYHVNE